MSSFCTFTARSYWKRRTIRTKDELFAATELTRSFALVVIVTPRHSTMQAANQEELRLLLIRRERSECRRTSGGFLTLFRSHSHSFTRRPTYVFVTHCSCDQLFPFYGTNHNQPCPSEYVTHSHTSVVGSAVGKAAIDAFSTLGPIGSKYGPEKGRRVGFCSPISFIHSSHFAPTFAP